MTPSKPIWLITLKQNHGASGHAGDRYLSYRRRDLEDRAGRIDRMLACAIKGLEMDNQGKIIVQVATQAQDACSDDGDNE